MLQSNPQIDEEQVFLSLCGYLRHYRFNLLEYLARGMEEFDSSRILMPNQTKIRIEQEISRVDLVLSSYSNYKKNTNRNEEEERKEGENT